jgi:hypothetical protein
MLRHVTAFALGAIVVATAPRAAAAQRQRGLWIELGLAPGWARLACDICDAGRSTGAAGHLGLGGQIGGRVRLGAELDAWLSGADGVPERIVGLSVVAHWRPSSTGPLRLRGGLAYVTYRVDDEVDVVSASGVGPLLGATLDWPVTDRLRLGPYATLVIGTVGGQVSFNGTRVQDAANINVLHAGVAATWR